MLKITSTKIPVLIGKNYDHVMADVSITEELNVVTIDITLVAIGSHANDLMHILTSSQEPMGISFVAIPVTPRNPDIKENN